MRYHCAILIFLFTFFQILICTSAHCQSSNSLSIHNLQKKGTIELKAGNYGEAEKHYHAALELRDPPEDDEDIAICLNNIGYIKYKRGDYADGLFYYQEAKDIYGKLSKDTLEAQSLVNLGINYKRLAIYDEAISFLLEGQAKAKKLGLAREEASALNSLGNIYKELENYDRAIKCHKASWVLREQIGYQEGIAGSLHNLGIIYQLTGNLKIARSFFHKAIELKLTIDDGSLLANSLASLAELEVKERNFTLADSLYHESLVLRNQASDKAGISASLYGLGELLSKRHLYPQASDSLNKAMLFAQASEAKDVQLKIQQLLKDIYLQTGKPEEALLLAEEIAQTKEDILDSEKQELITKYEVRFETKEKDRRIDELAAKTLLNKSELEKSRILIISLLAGLVLFGLLATAFYRISRLRLRNQKMEAAFLRELQHRVKNNLEILTSLFRIQGRSIKNTEAKGVMKESENRVQAMILLHKSLFHTKGSTTVEVNTKEFIGKLVNSLMVTFGYTENILGLDLKIEEIDLDADRAVPVALILNELITNAFKYAFGEVQSPSLQVHFRKKGESLSLLVHDNGPYWEMDAVREDSMGLGLVKTLGQQLQGDLKLSWQHGTKCTLSFPVEPI